MAIRSDDVLQHVLVVDVERLYGVALTEDEAEQVSKGLAVALTAEISKIKVQRGTSA